MEENIIEHTLCIRTCAEIFICIVSQQSCRVGTLYRLENRFRRMSHLLVLSLGGASMW